MTDSKETELKPCPFCGGEAQIQPIHGNNPDPLTFDVIHHCVFGFIRLAHKGPNWTEAEAITAWNTRSPDTAQDIEDKDEVALRVSEARSRLAQGQAAQKGPIYYGPPTSCVFHY